MRSAVGLRRAWTTVALGVLVGALASCAYRPFTGPLTPLDTQAQGMEVFDDGSVVFRQDRFEVTLRPMTDAELNRQFSDASDGGIESTNAYTYGDLEFSGPDSIRSRFTVFQVTVKNYTYPKVRIDPAGAMIRASNGRQYHSLSLQQLETYYRAYAVAYRGNEYARHRERMDMLRQTMLKADIVFSGQEIQGYLVFPVLHPDVQSLQLVLQDVVLRFDYRDEPVATIDITYAFDRLTGKEYASGERVITHQPQGR